LTDRVQAALPPGSTIGILGGGQLGRMLALAAAKLGLKCHIYSDTPDSAAAEVAAASTIGAFDDLSKLGAFAASVDVVTYEFENVPVSAAQHLQTLKPVHPSPQALAVAQDRLAEKRFMQQHGISVAPYAPVDASASLSSAVEQIGLPAILKTRRLGYDGKGQTRLLSRNDIVSAHDRIGRQDAVLERMVPFSREVSIIAVRGAGPDGRLTEDFYDCPENTHRNGILHRSTVPAPLPRTDITAAREIARIIMTSLDYVGVLAVEFFHFDAPHGGPSLLVNEIAPRVHNSGHWTMDACGVDQFENHIRAVAGWPLGSTDRHSDAEMTNLIGVEIDQWRELLTQDPHILLHIYGKGEARPGRKMGHLNRLQPRSA
jgi:5-(carboxyamino)imidazole ribonucleotide synthase